MDLKQLTAIDSVSGHEQAMRRVLLPQLEEMGLSPKLDNMGNVVAVRQGTDANAPVVLISAHMDEVGMIVVSADSDGFLKVAPIGRLSPQVVISKQVFVGDDRVPGVIGEKPIHLQSRSERTQPFSWDDVTIDIGAKTKDEALGKAPKGTYVSLCGDAVMFGDGCISAKALDSRIGVECLLRLLRHRYPCTIAAVFTSGHHVGGRGGHGASFALQPDLALVLDVTDCADLGRGKDDVICCRLGDGVDIRLMDGGSIAERALFDMVLKTAQEYDIARQVSIDEHDRSDAGMISLAREGIPSVVLSVPCRYSLTPSPVARLSDMEAQYKLIRQLLKSLNTWEG